jgi:hypothetical protein
VDGKNLHELAEERSLAMHCAVAKRLEDHPELLELARARVRGWLTGGGAHPDYARAWQDVLERPLPDVLAMLTDPTELGRSLRQASPFAGFLDPATRFRIHREVGARWPKR